MIGPISSHSRVELMADMIYWSGRTRQNHFPPERGEIPNCGIDRVKDTGRQFNPVFHLKLENVLKGGWLYATQNLKGYMNISISQVSRRQARLLAYHCRFCSPLNRAPGNQLATTAPRTPDKARSRSLTRLPINFL